LAMGNKAFKPSSTPTGVNDAGSASALTAIGLSTNVCAKSEVGAVTAASVSSKR